MFFKMSSMTPCEIQGILKLKRNPFRYGLGIYIDVEGVKWDIITIVGGKAKPDDKGSSYICARQVGLYPSYYGTGDGDNQCGSHTWMPYGVELAE